MVCNDSLYVFLIWSTVQDRNIYIESNSRNRASIRDVYSRKNFTAKAKENKMNRNKANQLLYNQQQQQQQQHHYGRHHHHHRQQQQQQL